VRCLTIALIFLGFGAGPALAQTDLFGPDTLSGIIDLRLGVSSGESSWLDNGLGKTRFGGANTGRASVKGEIASANLVWNPSIGDVSLVLDMEGGASQSHGVDLSQAYLQYKPAPTNALRVSARAGFFYPPISMEHQGYAGGAWVVANTITPSAINGWVGQEVKVVGLEGSARLTVMDNEIGATVGVFGHDDTAATLLALRGWTLDDVTSTATDRLPLPPLNSFLAVRQAPFTEPVRELDGRAGYYGRLDWRLPSRVALNAVYYDNNGDMTSVDQRQWAWETRFLNLGGRFDVDRHTWLIGQAMSGSTYMGFKRGPSVWVDVDFASAYLMAVRGYGRSTVSVRADVFSTSNQPFAAPERYSETGWAATTDYKFALTQNVALLGEVLHVWSDRPSRILTGSDPRQSQTTFQASARISF